MGLSRTPFARYYLAYLGDIILDDHDDIKDGEPWYQEKQLRRCTGGLISNDFSHLIKEDDDSLTALLNKCNPFLNKSYKTYSSEIKQSYSLYVFIMIVSQGISLFAKSPQHIQAKPFRSRVKELKIVYKINKYNNKKLELLTPNRGSDAWSKPSPDEQLLSWLVSVGRK